MIYAVFTAVEKPHRVDITGKRAQDPRAGSGEIESAPNDNKPVRQ
jgi:hypothetical protein